VREAVPPNVDGILDLSGPGDERAEILVEVKSRLFPRDVPHIVSQLVRAAVGRLPANTALVVVAPYVSPRTQDLLVASGAGYVDGTGNVHLSLERPALFLERVGASTDPWPNDHPLRSLKGPTAGRVVRALCDFQTPYGIRELAERSRTPVASVSRVVALLDREALVLREARGGVTEVQWDALIRRWTQDYSVRASNRVETYLEPRGLSNLLGNLAGSSLRHAVTGSLAAGLTLPIAPPRLATVYVEDRARASVLLGLRAADTGANVMLAEPFDEVAFERGRQQDGVMYAALSQVAADLLTGPGREPSEGDELLRQMGEHEADWRAA
jgi:hypothetical protein